MLSPLQQSFFLYYFTFGTAFEVNSYLWKLLRMSIDYDAMMYSKCNNFEDMDVGIVMFRDFTGLNYDCIAEFYIKV